VSASSLSARGSGVCRATTRLGGGGNPTWIGRLTASAKPARIPTVGWVRRADGRVTR
jgi:hypothetical protein